MRRSNISYIIFLTTVLDFEKSCYSASEIISGRSTPVLSGFRGSVFLFVFVGYYDCINTGKYLYMRGYLLKGVGFETNANISKNFPIYEYFIDSKRNLTLKSKVKKVLRTYV